jgi:hypothetical protein
LKRLFTSPILFLKYETAESTVQTILAYKNLYNTIKKKHLKDKIEDEQINELKTVLQITNFEQPYLHTVLYFDDTANNPLFRRPTNYFAQLTATCRHIQTTFFFATQFWKAIPTELKSNATTIYIFRDFSSEQLYYILRQTPLKFDKKKIYEFYRQLFGHEKLVVDTITGKLTIDKS